jgi:hypothetical protein
VEKEGINTEDIEEEHRGHGEKKGEEKRGVSFSA